MRPPKVFCSIHFANAAKGNRTLLPDRSEGISPETAIAWTFARDQPVISTTSEALNNRVFIYQRKDGHWCALVSLGFEPGAKAYRRLIYARTRAEVSESLKRILRDQQMGLRITNDRQTVGSFLTNWFENTVKPKSKQLTLRSYDWIIRIHIAPQLGKVPLAKLTPQRLRLFINERHASGLSATTVKHINTTLRAALSQAQRWQLVHQNAAKLITLHERTISAVDPDSRTGEKTAPVSGLATSMKHF